MSQRIHIALTAVLLGLAFVAGLSCTQHIADNPATPRQPRTYLWLFPDSTIGVGVSRQHLHWWGEDPDGVVLGYLFSFSIVNTNRTTLPAPDTLRYTWVTKNDSVFVFPLDTLFRKFSVVVRAVDNTFRDVPRDSLTFVRMLPFPYWDRNDNGIFDAGDRQLPNLSSALDPVGAVQTFPIRNTPPTLSFAPNPFDPTLPLRLPDTTYTVASFGWKGSDPDGDNTLVSYRIALNDTSDPGNWLTINRIRDTVVTLVVPRARADAAGATVTADVYSGQFLGRQLIGQIKGLKLDAYNVLFAQVKDVAGEYSPVITMPYGQDHWYVKRPRGRLLLVSDYINSDSSAALATFLKALAQIPGGEFASVDQLNIGRGLTANDKNLGRAGAFVPPYVDPALIQTFLLYDYVFWYTDQYPSLGVAQLSLFPYLQNGGKVLYSTTFQNTVDPRGALKDFAPIDSVSTAPFTPRPAPGDTRIPANFRLYADSSDANNIYPQLAFNVPAPPATFHLVFMRPIYRRSDARYIYHLQPDTVNTPPRYIGSPNVAVVDGQRQMIFIGLPLHLLDNRVYGNPQGLAAFFNKVFVQEFNPLHRVNRALY